MNIKSRIKRLESTSNAGACACPDIIVIRPGETGQRPCRKCFSKRSFSVVYPNLDNIADTPENRAILSSAGKVYAGFNPDLV